jgi:hypothetical protein
VADGVHIRRSQGCRTLVCGKDVSSLLVSAVRCAYGVRAGRTQLDNAASFRYTTTNVTEYCYTGGACLPITAQPPAPLIQVCTGWGIVLIGGRDAVGSGQ